MRRKKTADETWELIEEEGELENILGFFFCEALQRKKQMRDSKKQSYKNM